MEGDAARTRRLTAQARRRLNAANEEEARENLQARLNAYSKLMFWSYVTLLVFLSGAYWAFDIEVENKDLVFGGSMVMLGLMAFIWRIVLVRRTPSIERMFGIDLLFAAAIGLAFGASAALQYDLRAAGYTSLIFAFFTVFTRALLVPSSGRRTAIVSSITLLPLVGAGIYLGLTTPQDIPPAAYVAGGIMFCAVAVVISANGSRIIYSLRQQVSASMQLGQYTLGRQIGSGGMGAVYHAHHALLRRPTAIKLLHPNLVRAEDLDRFEAEVQSMSKLTHPNTVAIYDYGRNPEGVFYYAMEYLGGLDLEQLVRAYGRVEPDRVIHIMIQVCGALQEAHDASLIHRDIKPANIILCERGGVPDIAKVVDFGLVKEIATEPGHATQIILGTPSYLAPEAMTDPAGIGPAVDQYALGAVGYFLLTGRRVFDAKTDLEMCIQHVMQPPPPPSEVCTAPIPPALEAVILRCLAKAPSGRFASATALAAALDAVPRQGGWTSEDARAWWRAFRTLPHAAVTADTPTLTLTVDLEQRSA